MKGMRLGREKQGSSVGKKKRTDKQLKQKHKEEKNTADQSEEIAKAAPYFVDASCEELDLDTPFLAEKLLGCAQRIYLGLPGANVEPLNTVDEARWCIVGTVPARQANRLSCDEHQELLDQVATKPGICAVVTGVEYGKPPHGETKPPAASEDQKSAFEIHVKAALKWKVPIVLVIRPEAREAEESDQAVRDALEWLTEFSVPDDYKIFFSSWVGSPKMALAALKKFKNSVIGLNAAVTFRAASHLREIAFDTPAARIVIQSDAPHSAPMNQVLPHSPWTVLTVAACVAEQRRIETKELLKLANENTARFFGKTLRTPATASTSDDEENEIAETSTKTPEKAKPNAGAEDNLNLEDLKQFLE